METSHPPFALRGVEMHGDRMWSWRWVKRTLDFAAEHDLNAIVFHRNDLIDLLSFPMRYFAVEEIWARWPVRYHNIDNNRQYFRQILRYASDHGIAVYLEVKEISFHDSLLGKRPALWTGRGVCASDPFWWDFVEAKLEELLDALPGIAGVIISPATRETRVTISANECGCARCRSTLAADWYENLIRSMFHPLDRRGRTLAVRDFSYTRASQGAVLEGAGRVSDRIVISLKNTPHDYYPTFPHNPRIGHVGRHPQWVEFDTWGQFFGLGVFPAIIVDDIAERFAHCRASDVKGVVARTDWEVISDGSVFDTLNVANLSGFAWLARGEQRSTAELIDAVLMEPIATAFGAGLEEARFSLSDKPDARAALREVLLRSWEVMKKSVFVLRHVFHEDCMFPDTLRKAFMMLVEVHGLADWDPNAAGALNLGAARLQAIFAEKDEAAALVRSLTSKLVAAAGDLEEPGRFQLLRTAELWVLYVDGFRICARACFAARLHLDRGDAGSADMLREELDQLDAFRTRLDEALTGSRHTYLAYWMLDLERLKTLRTDLERQLTGSGKQNQGITA